MKINLHTLFKSSFTILFHKTIQNPRRENNMREHFDMTSLIVIIVTFILFTLALFTKGFTHDLLLEVGVFLVSVKLIIMAYKNSVANKRIIQELDRIKNILHDSKERDK